MPLSRSYGLDPGIEARFREIGYVFTPEIVELTRELFADNKDLSLPQGGARHDDVAYGEHERQRIDICTPGGSGKPVVVFVPGGGMVGGNKAFYAHIPAFFAREGFVGVGVNYRLAPEFLFPAGAEDVASVVDWLVENVAQYGGDPTRIFIVGQSAGAVHAASTLFDKRCRAKHRDAIRAAVLMSGVYEITPDHEGGNINLYFGNDADELKDRSSVNHVAGSDVPVIITVAEMEPTFFGLSAAALMYALTQRDKHAPQLLWLKGHNHLSPVLNMGSAKDELGPGIAQAFRAYC
jgi:triacylglycerol lipase